MSVLSNKGLYKKVLIASLIFVVVILAVLVLLSYPSLRTPDNLNIFLTLALVLFAGAEVASTVSRDRTEKRRKRTIDLRNELEKLYGPVYSVLNNVVYEEIKTGNLTNSQRTSLDETFSKEPFVLDSQEEWRLNIRNLDNSAPIPMRFVEYFNNEYERKKGENAVEKRFDNIHLMLKNIPQKVEEVGILHPDEKILIDERISNYPYMLTQ